MALVMAEHATHPVQHLERRRGDRRASRLQRTELGRIRSQLRAAAVMDRERADHLEQRLDQVERELTRLLDLAGLEPLPLDIDT
jgi:hypothetical protein